ncbi:MAG: rRNA maturation RNase YbeY [Anaerolineae bacterium]|nr:MAG: rRNA maturation RNase YbeY [Anaerolineae bacterium]
MIYVEISPTLPPHHRIAPEVLERAAREALHHRSAPSDATLAVVLTDDAQLHALNREYLGVDAPTDVLAFPANETDPETGAPYLGDVLISVPRAAAQATTRGHPLVAEVQLLVVHGVLHLLGYDHASAEEKARMWAAQAEVLERLGVVLGEDDVGE